MSTDRYEVYTTKGTLALVSNQSSASFGFGSQYIYTGNVTYDMEQQVSYDGDVSCEVGMNNAAHDSNTKVFHCLNVSDMFTFISWNKPQVNPPHINLYTAKRLYTKPYQYSTGAVGSIAAASIPFPGANANPPSGFYQGDSTHNTNTRYGGPAHYMTHVITTDLSTNWGVSVKASNDDREPFYLYKFFPAVTSAYNYVNECSNRGNCNRATGTCQCFPGYTNDDCGTQSSISL
jgi:hypothetical protein